MLLWLREMRCFVVVLVLVIWLVERLMLLDLDVVCSVMKGMFIDMLCRIWKIWICGVSMMMLFICLWESCCMVLLIVLGVVVVRFSVEME